MNPITPRPLVSPRLLHQLLNKVQPGDLVTGANIAGFVRVAEAMHSLGVV